MSYRSRSEGAPWWVYFIMIPAVLLIVQILAHTVSESKALSAAEGIGYQNVTVIDSSTWFPGLKGCGRDDLRIFYVRGIAPDGEERNFIVCAGLFKGGTPRF